MLLHLLLLLLLQLGRNPACMLLLRWLLLHRLLCTSTHHPRGLLCRELLVHGVVKLGLSSLHGLKLLLR